VIVGSNAVGKSNLFDTPRLLVRAQVAGAFPSLVHWRPDVSGALSSFVMQRARVRMR